MGLASIAYKALEKFTASRREKSDFDRYAQLCRDMETRDYTGFRAELGSEHHMWAERMVDRGLLVRRFAGTYTLNWTATITGNTMNGTMTSGKTGSFTLTN